MLSFWEIVGDNYEYFRIFAVYTNTTRTIVTITITYVFCKSARAIEKRLFISVVRIVCKRLWVNIYTRQGISVMSLQIFRQIPVYKNSNKNGKRFPLCETYRPTVV